MFSMKFVKGDIINTRRWRKSLRTAEQEGLTADAKAIRREIRRLVRKSKKRVSAPGQPPKGKKGNLKKSFKYKVGRHTAWIGSTRAKGAHGRFLTHGTPRMEKRPYADTALRNLNGLILSAKWRGKFRA